MVQLLLIKESNTFIPLTLRKIQIQCYHSQVDGLEDRFWVESLWKEFGQFRKSWNFWKLK